jgi:glutamate carboxypeptidase
VDVWVERHAPRMARRAEREMEALVAVSSPSGDLHGAEEAVAVACALLPAEAEVERLPCSTEGYADDLLARLRGTGGRRVLLLGHLDTVVAHEAHRPATHEGDRIVGSGTVDMKGGVALSIALLEVLAERPETYAEIALLLVNDEEWRVGGMQHSDRFEGFDACLCFEAGERGPRGQEGVIVRRKAASTLKVQAEGLSSHSGSAPDRGRNALLALAAAAQAVAGQHDPRGPDRLSAVPTIMRSGEAFNVVPADGELYCDMRADTADAFQRVLAAVPPEVGGARLQAEIVRLWPGMDSRATTAALLAAAAERLGRPVVPVERGGASDASHVSALIPVTVDGLGPRGGRAHNPDEYVLAESLEQRAEVSLALMAALLELR